MIDEKHDPLHLSGMQSKSKQWEAPPSPLNEPFRADAHACRQVLSSSCAVEDAAECLSTSEQIVVALAFGRSDLLPKPYDDFRSAWRRLDTRQRRLVDLAARGRWHGHDEGAAC